MRLLWIACIVLGVSACQSLPGNDPSADYGSFDAPLDCNDNDKMKHPEYVNRCGGGR